MALVSKNVQMLKLEKKGDKLSGYLVDACEVELPPMVAGQPAGMVPKLVLQQEGGQKFSVLLGATVREDVKFLRVGSWTQVEFTGETKTRRGMNAKQYSLGQDDDKKLV